jgi:mannose-6-phosphate isomerase-like protein (cupin superfamily)
MTTGAAEASVLAPGGGKVFSALDIDISFKTVGADTDGRWTCFEYTAPPRFSGPPPHWHAVTQEAFYVLEGSLTLLVGEETVVAETGGFAYVPPGVVHAFSNPSSEPARFLGIAAPAGIEEYFFELAELVRSEASWPPVDMGPLVALMARYDTFAPGEGPPSA